MGPKPSILGLLIRRDEDADTDKTGEEGPVMMGVEACSEATSQGTPRIAGNGQKCGEGHGPDSARDECGGEQGPVDLLTLDFWPPER